LGLSSIVVVGNSLRLRRFGRNGRGRLPVGSRGRRLASVALAAVLPAVLLGTLVLAAPDTFGVPRRAAATIDEWPGETLDIVAGPLRAGSVYLQLHLDTAGGRPAGFRSLALRPISSTGRTATVGFHAIDSRYEVGKVDLYPGLWEFLVVGTDTDGRPLRGSFMIPVN